MYKIIQWATGNVGSASLRSVVATPDFQLVGAYVYNPEKSGRDVGELCGLNKLGVMASSDPEAIIAMKADCVVFNALGDTGDPEAAEGMICRLLASGKNVVSTAITRHIHPDGMKPESRARIEEACRIGGVSYHSSGVNPGYAFEMLPIMLSAICDRIDHIHCVELVDMAHYDSRRIAHEVIGLGKPLDYPGMAQSAQSSKEHAYFVCAMLIQDAFGITFDDFVVTVDRVPTPVAIKVPWGVVEAGTMAALRIRMEAKVRGKAICTWDMIWRVSNDIAPDWPAGDSSWEVNITGEPTMRCRFDITSSAGRTVSLVTAMHAVNAIRATIAAEPGIVTRLDMGISGGGRIDLSGCA